MQYEENPFETERVAKEWIGSVEGEEGMFRDKIIYPLLRDWANQNDSGVILEIGSGQGVCSEKLKLVKGRYVGVESSQHLTQRAKELYGNEKRDFVVGNAYDLPLAEGVIDSAFSVNVWFHLGGQESASRELSRVLKNGGRFLIITANPDSYDKWQSLFDDPVVEDGKVVGKVNTPVTPLSKNIFYTHSLEKIKASLEQAGLVVEEIKELKDENLEALFVAIKGKKK